RLAAPKLAASNLGLSYRSSARCKAMLKRMRLFNLWVTLVVLVVAVGLLAGGRAVADGGRGNEATSLVVGPSCGATWQSVPSPSLWPSGSAFNGIAAAGSNDVWVVGSEESAHNRYALTEHWDGNEWRRVPIPALYPDTGLAAV